MKSQATFAGDADFSVAGDPQAEGIHFEGVERLYELPDGSRTGLGRVDLEVAGGEIFCLVGPSGCGKTTLLNILAGFDRPTAGRALVGDRAADRPSSDRIVVFQEPLLYPWLTVLENISFGPSGRGEDKRTYQSEAVDLLDAIGLRGFEGSFPYQLSGGMRQRVSLARALINRPRVLLMDEPFSALDAQTKVQMQQLFLQVWTQYRPTTVFITHDIDEAIFLADRVGVMQGRPGGVRAVFSVGISRPRTIRDTTSAAFVALKAKIIEILWR